MGEIPPDAQESLTRLLAEARSSARDRETEAVRDSLDAVRRLVEGEAVDGPSADRLLYGCDRVETLVADEPLVAAEYLRAMRERVADGA